MSIARPNDPCPCGVPQQLCNDAPTCRIAFSLWEEWKRLAATDIVVVVPKHHGPIVTDFADIRRRLKKLEENKG